MMASIIPAAILPARRPVRHLTPTRNPTVRGERIAQRAGRTISSMEDLVEMAKGAVVKVEVAMEEV